MKKIFSWIVLFLVYAGFVEAQDFDDTCNAAFEDISATGTALNLSDDGRVAITLPFDFTLTGQTSRDLVIGNNGGVLFGTTNGNVSWGNMPISDNNTPVGFYPFWDDMDNDTGNVYWEVKGTAPHRYLVVEWYRRPHYNNIGDATFELILYEGSNEVEFRYSDLDFGDNRFDYAASATIGIKAQGGDYQYSYNTAINSNVRCIHWTAPVYYLPSFTATVQPDCAHSQFLVDIRVTELGGASSVTVTDNRGSTPHRVSDTAAVVTLGPYADGTDVNVSVINDADTTLVRSRDVQYFCPPDNDECAEAVALSVFPQDSSAGHETPASTAHATQSSMGHTSCDSYGNNLDVFFSFTAPASGKIKVITGGGAGASAEAAVYDGCNGNEIACFGRSSEKEVSGLTPGTDYILQIWHDVGQEGDFTIVLEEIYYSDPQFETTVQPDCSNDQYYVGIRVTDLGGASSVTVSDDQGGSDRQISDTTTTVTFGPYASGTLVVFTVTNNDDTTHVRTERIKYYCPPENDQCVDALELIVGSSCNPVIGNNQGATDSGAGNPGCASYRGGDIWYYISAPQDMDTLIVETVYVNGSNFSDSGMAVYTGDCNSLSLVECDDDGGENVRSKITLTHVTANTNYYVRIWEYGNNDFGEIGVCAYSPALAAGNQLSAVEFRFFPNPTSGIIRWETSGPTDFIQLTDITGQILMSENNPAEHILDLDYLPAGIYMLRVYMNGRQGIYRVIKK